MDTFYFIVFIVFGIFHMQLSESQFSDTVAEVSIGGLTVSANAALPSLPTIPKLNWNNLPGFNLVHNKIATFNPLNILTGNHQQRQQPNLNQQIWQPDSGNQFNQYGPPANRGPMNNPPPHSHQPFTVPSHNNFEFNTPQPDYIPPPFEHGSNGGRRDRPPPYDGPPFEHGSNGGRRDRPPPYNGPPDYMPPPFEHGTNGGRRDRPPSYNGPPDFMPPPFEHETNGGRRDRPPLYNGPPDFMPPPFEHGSNGGRRNRPPPYDGPPDFMPPPFEHGYHGQHGPNQYHGQHGQKEPFSRHGHMPHYNHFDRNHPNYNREQFDKPNEYYDKTNEQPFNPNDEFEYIGTTTESTLTPTNKVDKNNPNSANLINKNPNSGYILCLKIIYPDSELYIKDREEQSQNYSVGIDPR